MLSETFRQPLTEAAIEGYIEALEDLDQAVINMARKRALRECRFMPTPMELRELAGISGPRVLTRKIADAWEAVVAAMRQHDYTTSVDFGPLVNAVIRNLGGWQAACAWTTTEIETWKRKEFERVYEAFAAGDQSTLRGEPLVGAFGGTPERIAIAGKAPPLQLAPAPNDATALVRELADAKSDGKPPAQREDISALLANDRQEEAAERKRHGDEADAKAAEKIEELRRRVAATQVAEASQ
ncbi:MAG: hypothetical protein ABUR63_00315 [Verrucomicrobiota bacterium]